MQSFCNILLLLLLFSIGSYGQSDKSKLENLSKTLTVVDAKIVPVKMGAKEGTMNIVSLNLKLNSKDTLYLTDLGYISGNKTLSYLTASNEATFKLSPYGLDSITLAIARPKETLGSAGIDFPDFKDLPSQFIDYPIKTNNVKDFDQKLQTIIQKYFLINPQSELTGGIIKKITTYRTVYNKSNLLGEVSFFFLFPYKNGETMTYKLGFKARQKKLMTDWKDADENVTESVIKFIADFTYELNK